MRRLFALLVALLAAAGCSGERTPPASRVPAAEENPAAQSPPSPTAGADTPLPATAGNSPPEIRAVRFSSGDGRPDAHLGVETEAFDADGDSVRLEIAWMKNGEAAGFGPRMAVPSKRGDKVSVTIVPYDAEGPGKPAVLNREILNTPPAILGHDRFRVEGNVVSFRVLASDADGDPISYSVKDAPAGMRIDPVSGWVRWETSRQSEGKVPFAISVSDGAGGESSARINITIREENASEAP